MRRVFRSTKLANLKCLKVFSFRSSDVNLPVMDLKNFVHLIRLELYGYFYENNIFMVLLENGIKLNSVRSLTAPYVHMNIISRIFPNLEHISSKHFMTPVFDEIHTQLNWTRFEHLNTDPCPSNVLDYVFENAPFIEELTLTTLNIKFVASLDQLSKLKVLNMNIVPKHLEFCLEQIPLFSNIIIEKRLKLRVNGLPVFDLNHLKVFIDEPFKSNYYRLSRNYDLREKDDLKYFFNNFTKIEMLDDTSTKMKTLKRFDLKLNNVKLIRYKANAQQSAYLFRKFFTRIPNLEELEISSVENLNQDLLNQLPVLWPNLMTIHLHASKMCRMDVKFFESFGSLSDISLENLNFHNDTNFKYVVRRLTHINQLKTINCLFNLKHVYLEFMKKATKHSNVQFTVNLNGQYSYSNFFKWKSTFSKLKI